MHKLNQELQRKIVMFEQLQKDGNTFIKFQELSADFVVRKLEIIEKSPTPIWKAFEKYYGYGFFNKVIESEFGINPDTRKEIGFKIEEEIKELRKNSSGLLFLY